MEYSVILKNKQSAKHQQMCLIPSNNDIYTDINKEKFKRFLPPIVAVRDTNACPTKYEWKTEAVRWQLIKPILNVVRDMMSVLKERRLIIQWHVFVDENNF